MPPTDGSARRQRAHRRIDSIAVGGSARVAEDPGRTLEVGDAEAGSRLDVFLAQRLELSRADVRGLLGRGVVRLDGRRQGAADKGAPLAAGCRVEVASFRRRAAWRAEPEPDLAFPVLASGPDWLVLDKPAGVAVHPYSEEERGTLLNRAAALRPEIQGVGEGGVRSGVVHRLDLDTSGCVVLASGQATWRRLRDAFRHHRVRKLYRAVAMGALPDAGAADLWLRVARHRPARVEVVAGGEGDRRGRGPRGARRGRLTWRVVEHLAGEGCLVEVDLHTGFLHQVRASLAHLGAPVAGDRVYGPAAAADPSGAPRQLLHAARLEVPELGIDATSPDPADLRGVLEGLRGRS